MQAEELKVGRTYRAKRPRPVRGFVNDRTILYIGATSVQYDSPSVAMGKRQPFVSLDAFLAWAGCDVTDELPAGQYADWPPEVRS